MIFIEEMWMASSFIKLIIVLNVIHIILGPSLVMNVWDLRVNISRTYLSLIMFSQQTHFHLCTWLFMILHFCFAAQVC